MIYTEPITHDGLSRTLFAPTDELVCAEISSPRTVSLKTRHTVEGVEFRCQALVFRSKLDPEDVEIREANVFRVERIGRETSKSRLVDQTTSDWWDGVLEYLVEHATRLLDDEPYVRRQQEIEAYVRADLIHKVNVLKRAVERIRDRAADDWLEVGSQSTGSLGNCEMEAAIKQAHLASAVETYDVCFRPYVSARSIAHDLTKDLPFRVNLHV